MISVRISGNGMTMNDEDKNFTARGTSSLAAETERGSAAEGNGRPDKDMQERSEAPKRGSAGKNRADLRDHARVGPEEESREAQIGEDQQNSVRQ
jgi:hypothetical protein